SCGQNRRQREGGDKTSGCNQTHGSFQGNKRRTVFAAGSISITGAHEKDIARAASVYRPGGASGVSRLCTTHRRGRNWGTGSFFRKRPNSRPVVSHDASTSEGIMKFFATAAFVTLAFASAAQAGTGWPSAWSAPQAPFRIVGNTYYVGTKDLAVYLITSPKGDVLIDGALVDTVPRIEKNIQSLGFKLSDIKLIVNTHAHFDHAAGIAQLKKDTGARFDASAADKPILETGTISFGPTKDALSAGDRGSCCDRRRSSARGRRYAHGTSDAGTHAR